MIGETRRRRAIWVYHLHMGGPDGAALAWQALFAPRYASRLQQLGVNVAESAAQADIAVLTGLLTARNLEAVMSELAAMPAPSVLVAAGDCAAGGGAWSKLDLPGVVPHRLDYFADIQVTVSGNPPTPQALLEGLDAAAQLLSQPGERVPWPEE